MNVRTLIILVLLVFAFPAAAQQDHDGQPASPQTTMFDHPDDWRVWISGQANLILQGHPEFPALYSGPNSLRSEGESAT